MDAILTQLSTSITEFKRNPNEVVAQAHGEAFAVLTNNKPSFYVLTPAQYASLLEAQWERDLAPIVRHRASERQRIHPVNPADL